jgi:hypothetical protein
MDLYAPVAENWVKLERAKINKTMKGKSDPTLKQKTAEKQ